MVVDIVKAFCTNKDVGDIIDNMNIADFTKLSEEVTSLIDTTEKKD